MTRASRSLTTIRRAFLLLVAMAVALMTGPADAGEPYAAAARPRPIAATLNLSPGAA